jgi:hypothetical protein
MVSWLHGFWDVRQHVKTKGYEGAKMCTSWWPGSRESNRKGQGMAQSPKDTPHWPTPAGPPPLQASKAPKTAPPAGTNTLTREHIGEHFIVQP